jgi:hypothetical protein
MRSSESEKSGTSWVRSDQFGFRAWGRSCCAWCNGSDSFWLLLLLLCNDGNSLSRSGAVTMAARFLALAPEWQCSTLSHDTHATSERYSACAFWLRQHPSRFYFRFAACCSGRNSSLHLALRQLVSVNMTQQQHQTIHHRQQHA